MSTSHGQLVKNALNGGGRNAEVRANLHRRQPRSSRMLNRLPAKKLSDGSTASGNVFFTSWLDESIGLDNYAPRTTPAAGNWGGLVFKRDLDLERKWHQLLVFVEKTIGKKPKDMNGVLFIIGMQELGQGAKLFSKEQKQDLLHIAICKVLSLSGYYTLEGLDKDGWPHWKMIKKLPHFDLL